ncbi:M14 family metallopeptidase [Paenibacillus silvae]|uniref:M14 family metallopeptidase n=1 Tax=Paenibacillus silvae TaxID=1325358 RepID=UPI003CF76943
MKLFSIRIITNSLENLQALKQFNLDLNRHSAVKRDDQHFSIKGILNEDQVIQIRQAGYFVEIKEDLSKVAADRLQEVSNINRFAGPTIATEATERTILGYLTVEEINSFIEGLQHQYPEIVTLIDLPHPTWEGRKCQALRLRTTVQADRTGVLILGNVHAREWGGSDICIHFLTQILQAYHEKTPITYGGKKYEYEQIRTLMDRLDIYVFPEVNPDGKVYSQTADLKEDDQNLWWRKNRRPNGPQLPKGVDLNRNFDFLWNSDIGSSKDHSSYLYKGPSPFSEPETQNVKYLLDTYHSIQYFTDIHSYGGLILYNWGDDNNQSYHSEQNFRNPDFDGKRGKVEENVNGDYKEYIEAQDEQTEIELAHRMNDALRSVRNQSYTVQQAVGLYPTSATSDDYAYSRHLTNPARSKIYSFTIEFGSPDGEFVPPYEEMRKIMDDVGAALTEMCLYAATNNKERNIRVGEKSNH